jgi:hypothetical protein
VEGGFIPVVVGTVPVLPHGRTDHVDSHGSRDSALVPGCQFRPAFRNSFGKDSVSTQKPERFSDKLSGEPVKKSNGGEAGHVCFDNASKRRG